LIAAYNLKYYWYFIFAGAFCGIEELFLYLGIFKHNWYMTWMTFAGLLFFFWGTKKIYLQNISKNIGNIWRSIYIFYGLLPFHIIMMWVFKLFRLHTFGKVFLQIQTSKIMIILGAYELVLGATAIALYFLKIKWWWKMAAILLLYVAHYFAAKFNLMHYKEGWFFVVTTIAIFSMYLYTCILDKLYDQKEKEYLGQG
jgi:hypothetical protein